MHREEIRALRHRFVDSCRNADCESIREIKIAKRGEVVRKYVVFRLKKELLRERVVSNDTSCCKLKSAKMSQPARSRVKIRPLRFTDGRKRAVPSVS